MKDEPWPPNYTQIWSDRVSRLKILRASPVTLKGAREYYRTHPIEFIEHWCDTMDPRNVGTETPARMPFIMFEKQKEFVEFLIYCLDNKRNGLVEKSRDMGATWVCVGVSVWLWLYHPGASIGWGSRKEEYVDEIGSIKSVFEKIRIVIRALPPELLPPGFDTQKHMSFMKIRNPDTSAEIIGESGDNIGRGGRTTAYFKDESAHYPRPDLIEAALDDNTNVQIDISSVNGLGNVFHRKRENGVEWQGPDREYEKSRSIVFVMDWSDHPAKDQAWYDDRKKEAENKGTLTKFAQEVDRDYAASVEGGIIPQEWIRAAIDADKVLGFDDSGGHVAGLDVADGGGDTNAFARRKGVVLKTVSEWAHSPDPGISGRRAISMCAAVNAEISLQYDAIGIGIGVRQEANRLKSSGKMPPRVKMTKWVANATPRFPKARAIKDDANSPTNKDFYANFKAQAWWKLRERFFRTWQAVVEGMDHDHDTLISIPSDLPLKQKLMKELAQATYSTNSAMKLTIDKSPTGTKSPNIADAVVMCYHPAAEEKTGSLVGTYGA